MRWKRLYPWVFDLGFAVLLWILCLWVLDSLR